MKKLFRRAAALTLAAALLVPTAFASLALGDELHRTVTPLADGASLVKQLFWSNSRSDLRQENYVTYTPGKDLSPVVAYGSSVLSKQTVTTMAKSLENTGKRVLSGSNGDYFDMGTGNPLGLLVTEGVLRSSASYLSAIGFTAGGEAVIGTPELTIEANISGHTLKVEGINKTRAASGYFLYNSDFGSATTNTEPGIDVILTPLMENLGTGVNLSDGRSVTQTDKLCIGGRMSFLVEEVLNSTGSVPIPTDKYVLSVNGKSGEWILSVLSALQKGDRVDLSITSADARWNDVTEAVGAMYRIVNNGAIVPGIDDGASTAGRTAVGLKPDGSVIFYTIDGRQSGYSVGASIAQVAERLVELGCVDAVCLDGGGSTTLVTTKPDSGSATVSNRPSEGSQRAVTNAIFLVSNLSAVGGASHIYVTPVDEVLAGGATTTFQTRFVDRNWYPSSSNEKVSFSAERGSFSDTGVYTAPTQSGVDTITAKTASGLSGTATVTVFASPNAIRVSNPAGQTLSALKLNAGDSIALTAVATYQTIPLKTDAGSFQWSVSPASLGSVTQSGVFTAASANGSGTLTITSGGHSANLPLTVSADGRYRLLDGFETSTLSFPTLEGAALNLDATADQVRFGEKSLRLSYDLTGGASVLSGLLPLESGDRYLSLWVYGDKSGGLLEATVSDSAGISATISFGTLDFSGWKQLRATLPNDALSLTSLRYSGGNKSSGILWLDQLCASNTGQSDLTAPTVSLTITGTDLSATVTDNADLTFQKEQLLLTINGVSHPFTFRSDSGILTATLPTLEGALHRVTVQATDQSGNIGRASRVLSGNNASSPFPDMSGHWAISYVDSLSSLGIVTGMEGGNFYPNRSITRGDFALMTARWMGLPLENYQNVTLPFQDAKNIPSWSENAIKAMYELGIMKGVSDKGALYAYARSEITRQEAMTILGRIQLKGYPESSLSAFKDGAAVPDWALRYVQSFVGQGVVSGYEDNTLRGTNPVSRAEVAKLLFSIW